MNRPLSLVRNIGISAHIDSGKTTLTERILYYTDRIRAMHEVRGKDGVGATMDSMELERERGITIQSAATYTTWRDHTVHIIDTPGHVDFTIEVERALRVLDGAVLVLCGVAGVQSQSLTVDRQMRRHNVPCVAFVNKLDRRGANPFRVCQQLREKLSHNAVLMQVPIGLEEKLEGMVDLVTMKALYFEGDDGRRVEARDIPPELVEQAEEYREILLDAASMFSDDLTEALLEEAEDVEELLRIAIREATVNRRLTPVFLGSAFRNKGIQPLLDGVVDYLPAPDEVRNIALDLDDYEAEVVLESDLEAPFVGLVFKLEDGRYGQLSYLRIYRGTLNRGDTIYNARTGDKLKVGRLGRMHSQDMQEIEAARAGDIVALFGVECRSGDTFTPGERLSMSSMHVPEAVVSYGISAPDSKSAQNLSKALGRFSKEDPTFRVAMDPETGETVISGMGELHLDVYVERIRREYNVPVEVSQPQVAYRESITRAARFDYLHKKQTGGSGQYGKVVGGVEPLPDGTGYEFVDKISGGVIPREFIPACDKGFRSMLAKGRLIGAPVIGVQVTIDDGKHHAQDSSEEAFREAARGAWRQVYERAGPIIREPVMKVEVEGPAEYLGAIVGTLLQRRGLVVGTTEEEGFCQVEGEVPLAEMFGYATTLRSATQGRAEFTMEFASYEKVPQQVADELIREYQTAQKR